MKKPQAQKGDAAGATGCRHALSRCRRRALFHLSQGHDEPHRAEQSHQPQERDPWVMPERVAESGRAPASSLRSPNLCATPLQYAPSAFIAGLSATCARGKGSGGLPLKRVQVN
jgi:hypothetical protein